MMKFQPVACIGHSAAIPVPGTLVQHISKSGGNAFRGSVYADFQSDAWEATRLALLRSQTRRALSLRGR